MSGLYPKWPEVRCDTCHTVYSHPDANRDGVTVITGKCPQCGGGTFSTTMNAGTPPQTLGEARDRRWLEP